MRLRVFTTAMMVVAFCLMCLYPFALQHRPHRTDPKPVRVRYLQKMLALNTGMILSFSGAAICSILIIRRAREEYRSQAEQNMRILVEGALADHERKKQS